MGQIVIEKVQKKEPKNGRLSSLYSCDGIDPCREREFAGMILEREEIRGEPTGLFHYPQENGRTIIFYQ